VNHHCAGDTGKQTLHSGLDHQVHELTAQTVVDVMAAVGSLEGRERDLQRLKNKGYHFEHNFGHGRQYLSAVLLSLLFLPSSVTQPYICLAPCIRPSGTPWARGGTSSMICELSLHYLYFPGWDEMITFMFQKLELDTG